MEFKWFLFYFLFKVTESLRTFGLSDDSKNVILATVNDDSGSKLSSARKKIKGKVTPLAKLREIANYDMIKQVCWFAFGVEDERGGIEEVWVRPFENFSILIHFQKQKQEETMYEILGSF